GAAGADAALAGSSGSSPARSRSCCSRRTATARARARGLAGGLARAGRGGDGARPRARGAADGPARATASGRRRDALRPAPDRLRAGRAPSPLGSSPALAAGPLPRQQDRAALRSAAQHAPRVVLVHGGNAVSRGRGVGSAAHRADDQVLPETPASRTVVVHVGEHGPLLQDAGGSRRPPWPAGLPLARSGIAATGPGR